MFLTDFADIFGKVVDEASSPVIKEITVTAPLTPESIRSPRRQMFSDLPTPAYNQTSFQTSYSLPIQHPTPHEANDTGFIPMHPSYETKVVQKPASHHEEQQAIEGGFGSLNGALALPKDVKARRRESGMLLVTMGMGGPRNLPGQKPKGSGEMVRQESAFD